MEKLRRYLRAKYIILLKLFSLHRYRTVKTTLAFDAAINILTDFDQSNLYVSDEKLVQATQHYETSDMNLNHVVKHRNDGKRPRLRHKL